MCGRYNIIDSPEVGNLMDILGLTLYPETRYNIAPGSQGQIVYQVGDERYLDDAYWSLLMEPKPDGTGYRPSPDYSTFNARSGSLGSSPLWKPRFHSQRAIIPASGFHEWTGEKGHKQCYNIRAESGAIAFAGLYEIWDFEGERVPAFTIVTLPPHPRFSRIHPKSIPLMLRPDDFDMWLDPYLTNTDPLQHLLKSQIRQPIIVEPVRSPERLEPVGEAEHLQADA
ncbi:SOS response-associated peptidase [Marinobacter zhejiangensis]|uniref:Abasic site processing protein n=1 Tax=Marinobacter zhejiangensis TaxID=488535 RepID=A0A1I4TLI1_9GAMM|nr:SOS response-associated peptidase [Marinobacter zhejiangensis]SFM77602.1 Putative SOS response-associated peptidase YedK [Marinobacter zhejiangensis]